MEKLKLTTEQGEEVLPAKVWNLGPAGLRLQVGLGDAPSSTIAAIALSLQAPAGSYELTEPVAWNWSDLTASSDGSWPRWPPDQSVRWICAELGQRLPVAGVKLEERGTRQESTRVRVKAAEGDVWLPVAGADGRGGFPPLAASKLMLEVVNDKDQPASATVAAVKIFAACQPREVSVAIGDAAPFFRHAGPLPVQRAIPVDNLLEALNQYLQQNPNERKIVLTVRAQVAGRVLFAGFSGTSQPVKREPTAAEPPPAADTAKPSSPAPLAKEELPRDGLLCSQAGARADLGEEFKLDPPVAAAQSFPALEKGTLLTGLELYVRPLRGSFQGTVALYPDQSGQPASTPGVQLAIELAENAAGWVGVDLEKPLLFAGSFWIVLTARRGEAIWYGADQKDRRAAYRLGAGAWLIKEWSAWTRLRTTPATAPKGSGGR